MAVSECFFRLLRRARSCSSLFLAVAVAAVTLGISVSVSAQALDPDLLKKFEEVQGEQRAAKKSPVDVSREQAEILTEEDVLAAEEERKEKKEYSALETDYQKRASALLEQYGYDVFDRRIRRAPIVTGRVPESYILGVGDEVVVTFHGSTAKSVTVPVDREGRIVLEDLSPIDAAGRTFAEVRRELRERTKSALIGTEAFVSVGALRLISVYVVGEIYEPGLYRVTGLASVLEALNRAGGVKKTGTLRRIRVHRGTGSETIDLYDLFSGGGAADFGLQDGDRIVVPTIGPTAAVSGGAVRPGIYELKGRTTAGDLLRLAGGSLRPTGYKLLLSSFSDAGKQEISGFDDLGRIVSAGDIVTVSLREGGSEGVVDVVGHIRSPGARSLAQTQTLKDLLPDPGVFKDYPYLLFGVVETTDPDTFSKVLKPFSPQKVIFGGENLRLRNRDKVILFGRDDVEFLSANVTRRTVITGTYDVREVADAETPSSSKRPQLCQPLEELARIVNDTRSERFAAAVRAVYIQLDATQSDLVSQLESQRERRLAEMEALRTADAAEFEKQRLAAQAGVQNGGMQVDEEKAQLERIRDKDNRNCPSIYSEARNLLPFVLEYVVSVDGAVRRPGVYPVTDDTALSALSAAASGTTANVDLTNIELLKYSAAPAAGDAAFDRQYLNAAEVDLSQVLINAGSGVRFNSLFVGQEPGGVLLSGEFRRPGVYTIRRGEKLSELIDRAGGLTEQAYPYGAVFMRERVKQAQQLGLKRTERELNMGLATAALKHRELSGEVLLAAQQLAAKISSVEMVGRVVIEADPRVLNARPDLDTVLEPGDRLHIPKRPNYVLLLGDILNPGALQFAPGKDVRDYVDEAGGIQKTADDDRIFVVLPNGVAKPVRVSSWGFSSDVMVPPGTSIIVPKDVEPIDTIMLVKDLAEIFSQLAVSAASIAVISR